jgi:hypothetical protein
VHNGKRVLHAGGREFFSPHAALRSASLAWGYENPSPPGLLNGEWRHPTGDERDEMKIFFQKKLAIKK